MQRKQFVNDNSHCGLDDAISRGQQPMSPRLAMLLAQAKHDAVHVRDLGLADASDEIIFSRALSDNRIILTQDTDFGTILGLTGSARPSVLTFRCRFRPDASWVAAPTSALCLL
jgi:predicted nuclease of predicted toxin-antitoxin system